MSEGVDGLSVVVPTFQRGQVALDSVAMLRALGMPPLEIVLVDQTSTHPEAVAEKLADLHQSGSIRWIRLAAPSIPAAMNEGLRVASGKSVLFLDDDIVPDEQLVAAHMLAQERAGLVAGQVLQPGQSASPLSGGEAFRFNSSEAAEIDEFMGGNFSINREMALALGGFDENFIGAAYRFEAEFAHRYVAAHGAIRFEPRASIRHLAIPSGGTRAFGHHLRTARPGHSVGAYYYLLRTRRQGWWLQLLWRPFRAIRTRHHLRNPWWIPATLVAEVGGFLLALGLAAKGPKLLSPIRASPKVRSK